MATTMHRLQISLPEWQHQFLVQRARRDGISAAEVVRRLVASAARLGNAVGEGESLWAIAGIAEDHLPLREGVPVSEAPESYLPGHDAPMATKTRPRRGRR